MPFILPKINGIELTKAAAEGFSQSYDRTPKSTRRMMTGTLKAQQNYAPKITTTLSGSGYMKSGWEGFDLSQSITLSCAEAVSIASASNVINIPAARRGDVSVVGFAVVNGVRVPTAVSMAVDVATLTIVGGASHYIAGYYPEFTAFAEMVDNGRQAWTLTAQEI